MGKYNKPVTDLDAYLKRMTKRAGDCLVWQGTCDPRGFPRVNWGGVKMSITRIVYEHHHGPIPEGMKVYKSCGRIGCLSRDHLKVGTHKEIADHYAQLPNREPRKPRK